MNIQIKNIGVSLLTFNGSLLIESQELAAGVTKTVGSPYYEFFDNQQVRDYINSDNLELYIGTLAVAKSVALAMFDTPQKNTPIIPPVNVTSNTVLTTNQLFVDADIAANGGTLSVTLAAIASYPIGSIVRIRQKTAGQLTVVSASQIVVNGVTQSNITSRQIGNIIELVSNGTQWVLMQEAEIYNIRHRGRLDSNLRVIASVFPITQIDNWDIFTTDPLTNIVVISSAGTTPITGIVPPNANLSTEVTFIVFSGTFTFNNNDAGSTATNRFSIGNTETISSTGTKSITLIYSPTLQRWVIKK